MNNAKGQTLGIRVLLALGMLLVMAMAGVDTPAGVSAHGGDTGRRVHLCVNDTTAQVRVVHPQPIGGPTMDCVNPPWPLVPGWSPVDVGTISGVTAGTGLTGGGSIGPVTLDADTTFLQQRVSGICAAGSSIRVINQDGTVACEADDVGGGGAVGGSGILNFIPKFTGPAAIGDSGIFEDALGNVGIGTTAPGQKLQVGNGLISPDVEAVQLRVAGNEPVNWKGGAAFGHNGATVIMGELFGVANIGGHSAAVDAWDDLAINLGGGNVGIGTDAPNEQLEITGNFRLPFLNPYTSSQSCLESKG